jgi:hypothetical protein
LLKLGDGRDWGWYDRFPLGAVERGELELLGIERELEPAQGGRSECVARAVWFAPFDDKG